MPEAQAFVGPPGQREAERDQHAEREQEIEDVVHHVVTDLVRHDRLDTRRRAPLEQVVVERDPLGAEHTAHVGADSGALARGVHLPDVGRVEAVRARDPQDGLTKHRVLEARICVEDRRDEHGIQDVPGHLEQDDECRAPDPPCTWSRSQHPIETHERERSDSERQRESFQLIAKPRTERLCRQAVLMLAQEISVDREGKRDDRRRGKEHDPICGDLERAVARQPAGRLAHPARPAGMQECEEHAGTE